MKMKTEYLIKEIAEIVDDNRKAIIFKKTDETITFKAVISPDKTDANIVIIYPVTEDHSEFSESNPFCCSLKEAKTFKDLCIGDVLYSEL